MQGFERVSPLLVADLGAGRPWILATALALFAAWLGWACLARVRLYEVTDDARIELTSATYPIESPLLGRVTRADLHVGQAVHQGDVLVEIDSVPQQLQLVQVRTEAAGLGAQLDALHAQIEAEQGAQVHERASAGLGAREAEQRMRAAAEPARFAQEDLERLRRLREQKLVSLRDLEKAQSDAMRLQQEFVALRTAAGRVPRDEATRAGERDVRVARLQGEIATLDARRAALEAQASLLAYEIERRRVRAPVDGHVGEALDLRIGTVVAEGDSLGAIVPAGELRIVARYPASAAFGRLHPGQAATLRLQGFAWAEFGTVSATVAHVAQEAREGKVRVELALAQHSSFRGTLEHGMPGSLEVQVEQVSPFGLLLRTAGQRLTEPAGAPGGRS